MIRIHPRSHRLAALIATAALTVVAAVHPAAVSAQAAPKKILTVDDYSRWRSINNASISGDGKWVTYVLSQTNTTPADAKPVVHLLRLDTNQDIEIPNATAPAPGSTWR